MEKYEVEAISEWKKLYPDGYPADYTGQDVWKLWKMWLKAYQTAMEQCQDKMYSREDMIEAYNAGYQDSAINENYTPDEWLQQYEEQHKQ